LPRLPFIEKFDGCRKKFGFRIFFSFIGVILSVLTVFSLLHAYQESRAVKERLVKKAEMMLHFLVNSCETALFAEDKEALKNIVEGVINQEEVLEVSIYSRDWEVIYRAEKNASETGMPDYKGLTAELSDSGAVKVIDMPQKIDCLAPVCLEVFPQSAEALFFETVYPKERVIGFAQIALDKAGMTSEIKNVFFRVLLLGIVLSLSGAVIIFVAAQKVSMPLIRLTENVRKLGEEGSAEKIEPETCDEIGNLAAAFNKMAENLRNREFEKRALERELIHAKKMEAVGTLSRGIAHDFNNILATIQGASFILKKRLGESSPMQQYVKKIHNALARAENLIQSLIAFSSGQFIEPVAVNINEIVRILIPYCEKLPGDKIRSDFSVCDEELFVLCDRTRIERVLLNLISNARDAMPEGGVLAICTDISHIGNEKIPALRPGVYALITVSDTGTGISEEITERIFEPFFTTKETGKGTGLGLSIAYGIISQYKGFINVSSQPGEGTSFHVFLPLCGVEKIKESRQKERDCNKF
jgi:signal transduction histidine kinase